MSKSLNKTLVNRMRKSGVLKSAQIIKAFLAVDRINFVPDDLKDNAYLDVPAPIAADMTTSQPSTIAFMLELLEVKPGEKIMEIGAGSGYLTALLAELTGETGEVRSIEVVPELKEFAENNLKKYKHKNIGLYLRDGKAGIPEKAPFDKIISGAEAEIIPVAWKKQLKIGGIIVTPLNNHVLQAIKTSEEKFEEKKFPYFSFIKLV